MRWVRGGVHFAEGLGGTFSEILTENPKHTCVVMVDTAEYAAMTFRLAAEIRQRRIPLVVVIAVLWRLGREDTRVIGRPPNPDVPV